MLDIESARRLAEARSTLFVQASPDALRECANRLEALHKTSWKRGETILTEFTGSVTLVFKPEHAHGLEARAYSPFLATEHADPTERPL